MKKKFLTSYVAGLCFCISLLVGTTPVQADNISAAAQQERDAILSLLTLAFVHNDWQTSATAPARGHNIGSVLVNGNGIPVFWTRNAIKLLHNSTQHGEVRLATQYLSNIKHDKYIPNDYVLYTSLEPCAMCTGMLSMVKTKRVVYVQQDPEYGNVPSALKNIGYPRLYEVVTPSSLEQKNKLDQGWITYKAHGGKSITEYLLTDEAKQIYQSAAGILNTYRLTYVSENTLVLTAAKLLANSSLPELTRAAESLQKIWQVKNTGDENWSPTLFIEYLDWNNTKNTAQISGKEFYICTTGKCVESNNIQYKFNKEKWTATIKDNTFMLTKQGPSTAPIPSKSVKYTGWDATTKEGEIQNILLPD